MCFCTFTFWLFNKGVHLLHGLKLGSTLPPHSFRRAYIYSLEKIIIWSPETGHITITCIIAMFKGALLYYALINVNKKLSYTTTVHEYYRSQNSIQTHIFKKC